ncbi:MAG: HIT domain-containing protein [Bdellovibrionota bacterium]
MADAGDFYCDEILTEKTPVEIVRETMNVLAFKHTQPYWETHIVVIPKVHVESLSRAGLEHGDLLKEMMTVSAAICRQLELQFGGCRLSTNVGDYQTTKHLHFYIHCGRRLRNEDGSAVE